MIRPVVGKPIPLGTSDLTNPDISLLVYPNPCTGNTLNIRLHDPSAFPSRTPGKFTLRDMMGRIRMEGRATQLLDVSGLGNGIYFLETHDQTGIRTGGAKVIISR
jgi:hypothetical protein